MDSYLFFALFCCPSLLLCAFVRPSRSRSPGHLQWLVGEVRGGWGDRGRPQSQRQLQECRGRKQQGREVANRQEPHALRRLEAKQVSDSNRGKIQDTGRFLSIFHRKRGTCLMKGFEEVAYNLTHASISRNKSTVRQYCSRDGPAIHPCKFKVDVYHQHHNTTAILDGCGSGVNTISTKRRRSF